MSQYAETTDLDQQGLPAGTIDGFDAPTRVAILQARSAYADSFLRGRYTLPLSAWDASLTMAVVHLASWDLVVRRGFNPSSAWDQGVYARSQAADAWLAKIPGGTVSLAVTDATPTDTSDDNAGTFTAGVVTRRNWNRGR